ncbi:MAG: PHP domain-containing protein [Bacteroidetes bacterium]|nr:PHP domain-containing protein [Bacteroidota bacterium]
MIRGSFHNHTRFSDGKYSPEQVLKKYKSRRFTHLSITDHDNAGSYPETLELASALGLTVFPGLEFSTQFLNFSECHIIGLNIRYDHQSLREYEDQILGGRRRRAAEILNRMKDLNVEPEADVVAELYTNPSVGRPHIAQILIRYGAVKSVQEGFQKYLMPGKPLYVKKEQWEASRVIGFIHSLGGKSILAHPTDQYSEDQVRELIGFGLDGVEVIHPLNKLKHSKAWRLFAQKNNLIISGGADYHGLEKSEDRHLNRYYLEGDDMVRLIRAVERN